MASMSRREMLRRLRAVAALPLLQALPGCGDDTGGSGETGETGDTGDDLPVYEWEGDPGPENIFECGVASGDPLPDGFIAWTRVSVPETTAVEVFLEIATDANFDNRVAADYYASRPMGDQTVKIDVAGLEAGTTYYYRFYAQGRMSMTGRTKTAPADMVEHVRIGVASCSSLAHGYFHAYARMAERDDLDVVLHLGDYIYEYGNGEYGSIRTYEPPTETITLADYRTRYAQYRKDADLQALHAAHPMVIVWDDHESADNAYSGGAANHDPSEGDFAMRRQDSTQAFFEWVPIREGEAGVIYRALAYGSLVDIIMLDTRIIGRDEQPESQSDLDNPDRNLLGDEQAAWLEERLGNSTAKWKLLGQQVMMGQLKLVAGTNAEGGGTYLNLDQWDGYQADRNRLWNYVVDNNIDNFVVVTGDIHTSWAIDLTFDPNEPTAYDPADGTGAIGTEFVCCSVTSPSIVSNSAVEFVQNANPHIHYIDLEQKGYMVLDITADRLQCDWYYVANHEDPAGGAETWGKGFTVADGVPHVVEASAPA